MLNVDPPSVRAKLSLDLEIEELLDLDVEPMPESLWCTSTYKDEDVTTMKVGSREKIWDLPFVEVFDVLGNSRDGKGVQETEKTPRQ